MCDFESSPGGVVLRGGCVMESLSRTTSRESVTSNEKSQARSPSRDMQDLAATDMSRPPSPSNAFEPNQPLAATSRVPSHSLLPAFQNAAVPSRKSRFADVGTIGGNIGRASVSMPPPATKSSSIYKPSTVRRHHRTLWKTRMARVRWMGR